VTIETAVKTAAGYPRHQVSCDGQRDAVLPSDPPRADSHAVRGTYAVKQDALQDKKPERRKRKVRITPLHQRRINRQRRLETQMSEQRDESPAVRMSTCASVVSVIVMLTCCPKEAPPQPKAAAPVIRRGHVEVVIYVKPVKK
jgi:hypothetical protein